MLHKFFDYPGPLWKFYSFWALFVVFLSVPLWGSVVLLRVLFPISLENESWYIASWNLFVLRVLRIKVRVEGREHFDHQKSSLVVSNHQSLFDIPVAFEALAPAHLRMVAKKELFDIPIFGQVISKTHFIPVKRSSIKSGVLASAHIKSILDIGIHVWVAPEGTRALNAELLPFKKGSFGVAIEAKIPVQPLLVVNAYQTCPKGAWLPRPGSEIFVKILPPILPGDSHYSDRAELCDYTSQLMREAMKVSTSTT